MCLAYLNHPAKHNAYLDAIIENTEPLRNARTAMAKAAGAAGASQADRDIDRAGRAMKTVRDQTAQFLDRLARSEPPHYMRGADGQLQDALKLIIDGARRGLAAADSRNGEGLAEAAHEIDIANRDIVTAASRITNWRSGAAAASDEVTGSLAAPARGPRRAPKITGLTSTEARRRADLNRQTLGWKQLRTVPATEGQRVRVTYDREMNAMAAALKFGANAEQASAEAAEGRQLAPEEEHPVAAWLSTWLTSGLVASTESSRSSTPQMVGQRSRR